MFKAVNSPSQKSGQNIPIRHATILAVKQMTLLIRIVLVVYESCPLCTRHGVMDCIDILGIALVDQCSFDNALLAASHLTSLSPMTPARRQWLTQFDDFIYLT